MRRSSSAIAASCAAAASASPASARAWAVVDDTAARLLAIRADSSATSPRLRLISFVVAVCSSMAAATDSWLSLMCSIVAVISAMAVTAAVVSRWMSSIWPAISPVALAVSWDSSLTWPATTAKPAPAWPARAASMVALRASRLVWSAIDVMTCTTEPIDGRRLAEPVHNRLGGGRRGHRGGGDRRPRRRIRGRSR